MHFIEWPNLPEKSVKLVLADGRISSKIEKKLLGMGIGIIGTKPHKAVYEAICCHPDIMLHHIGGRDIVCMPDLEKGLEQALTGNGFNLITGKCHPGPKYPGDIAYNVARVGNYAFHNFKFTDPVLVEHLKSKDVELVNVKQGYAKCSISVVDQNSIITADCGIAKAAADKGLNVLLIEAEENIRLPGLKCGFIGGCTGLIDKNKWAISGDFETLKSARRIYEFLKKRNMEIVSLSDEAITDIGTIIPLLTV